MKNPDRVPDPSRGRKAGDRGESPDGKEIAERLYGGFTDTDKNTDSTDGPSE